MKGRRIIQVHFGGPQGAPLAVSKKHKMKGRRVVLEVEHDVLSTGRVFLLHRVGAEGVVLVASNDRHAVERVRAGLGHLAGSYEISDVPVVDAVA